MLKRKEVTAMTRFPDREKPKGTLLVNIEENLICVPEVFRNHPSGAFSSVSSYVETLVFLTMDLCHDLNIEDKVIKEFAKTKLDINLSNNNPYKEQTLKRLHVSLDRAVINFIRCLRKDYPFIFSSQSEIMKLILIKAQDCARNESEKLHQIQRLSQVLINHPKRHLRHI